ncbi:MAG: hypothetical protein AAB426_15335 [Myxococcota bacterium]
MAMINRIDADIKTIQACMYVAEGVQFTEDEAKLLANVYRGMLSEMPRYEAREFEDRIQDLAARGDIDDANLRWVLSFV